MTKAEQLQIDIKDLRNWKRTCAKQYEVYICMPVPGTETRNVLEKCVYKTDQERPFIVSGTLGETWTISADKFVSKYGVRKPGGLAPVDIDKYNQAYLNGQTIDWRKFEARPGQSRAWAFFLDMDKYGNAAKNFTVQTSWGDYLTANCTGIPHGHGDFLLCEDVNGRPDLNNMWVVNGRVFVRTYNLQQFKNLGVVQDDFVTPRPNPCKLVAFQNKTINYVQGSNEGDIEDQEQTYDNSRFNYYRVMDSIIRHRGHYSVNVMYSWNRDWADCGFGGQVIGYLYSDYNHILGIVVSGTVVRLINPAELTGRMLGYDSKTRVQSKDYKINIGGVSSIDSEVGISQTNQLMQKIDSVLKGSALSEKEAKLVNTFIDIAYEKDDLGKYQKDIDKYKIPDQIANSYDFGVDWASDPEYSLKYDKKHHIENRNGAAEPVWQAFLSQLKQSDIHDRIHFVGVFDRDLPGFKNCKVAFIKSWNDQTVGIVANANGKIDVTYPLSLARSIESYGQKGANTVSKLTSFSINDIELLIRCINSCFDNVMFSKDKCSNINGYFKIWQSKSETERRSTRYTCDISNTVVYDSTFKRINFLTMR